MRPERPGDSAQRWSIAGADRLGPVGRFIRTTSLDELPQLFNILKGDMSLVGPRPERPHFVEQFSDRYDSYGLRDRVRPGLTGWAAVNGLRGDTSIEERAYFDNVYIDNWSLGLDLKILVLTALAVVRGTGS
jgi:lipopolysaccharide/colanic/teichoic acid biosynthesis glycosyltransferase